MDALQAAKEIMKVFHDHGYECLIVGGYVRNRVLGLHGGDLDLATNAEPDVVMKLFKRVIPTGIKHGTVTVVHDKYQFEVTTYRSEGTYRDRRHPDQVQFETSFAVDVLRRDFTMNALGMTYDEEIIDHVGGIQDIKARVIRTVGDAEARMNEDALRMLRAFRFQSQLGFKLHETLKAAIERTGSLIEAIAMERILMELEKLAMGEHFFTAISSMLETRFIDHLPLFKPGLMAMLEHKFQPKSVIAFYAVIALHASFAEFEQLPLSNYLRNEVRLVYEMYQVGIRDFNEVLLFRQGLNPCLILNQINQAFHGVSLSDEEILHKYESLPIKRQCDLVFKGDQIIAHFNRKPGAWISDILDDICLQVLTGKLKNDYDAIYQYLLKNY